MTAALGSESMLADTHLGRADRSAAWEGGAAACPAPQPPLPPLPCQSGPFPHIACLLKNLSLDSYPPPPLLLLCFRNPRK